MTFAASTPAGRSSGPAPDPVLERLDRRDLAILVREYLLLGHLIDRAGMPQVIGDLGKNAMRDVAIDEWMGASPIYTRRMQRLLGYEGDTVETMFKGIQFDIGSPPQFMDFRFLVDGRNRGEFWLRSCGALLDAEPLGDEFVLAMCHDIEDPTFDATAAAVNPRARVRPIHRPPRQPSDRHPHCHWTVTIDPLADPVDEPAPAVRIGETRAARQPLARIPIEAGDDGRHEYPGPLEDDVHLEEFSAATLRAIANEVCRQGHLLTMSFVAAIETRFGADRAASIARRQFIGIAGLAADRLRRAFDLGRDLDAMATVLDLHPAFRPREYVRFSVERQGDTLALAMDPCEALAEPRELSWPKMLDADFSAPLDAMVRAIDPRAHCEVVGTTGDELLAWRVTIGDHAAPEAPEVQVTRFSTGADFVFEPR